MTTLKFRFSILIVLFMLSSCVYTKSVHGYLQAAPLNIGDTKAVVSTMSGEPTLIDGDTWYYIKIDTKSDSMGLKNYYTSKVIKAEFENDILKRVTEVSNTNDKISRGLRENDKDKLMNKLNNMFDSNKISG